jgi:hypothetical protein
VKDGGGGGGGGDEGPVAITDSSFPPQFYMPLPKL